MKTDKFEVPIECREADESREGPGRINGTILLEAGARRGRPVKRSSRRGRADLPGIGGSTLHRGHRGPAVMSFEPVIDGSAIRIDARLPDTQLGRQVATEVRSGERASLSVEFVPLDEARVMGVRELRSALINAAALVPLGSYNQARAEIRHRAARRFRRSWQ